MLKTVAIIPARLASSRLPEKILLELKGKTMIQRVYERASLAKELDKVYIATDSQKIYQHCLSFTKNIFLTRADHQSGSDRIAEALQKIDCEYAINIQGDEPLIEPTLIDKVALELKKKKGNITAAYPLKKKSEILDPCNVKVVLDKNNKALYFSRNPIPYSPKLDANYFCHLGIYGYTKTFLDEFIKMPRSKLEIFEGLEQLRALENGYSFYVVLTKNYSPSVDTAEDVQKILNLL